MLSIVGTQQTNSIRIYYNNAGFEIKFWFFFMIVSSNLSIFRMISGFDSKYDAKYDGFHSITYSWLQYKTILENTKDSLSLLNR